MMNMEDRLQTQDAFLARGHRCKDNGFCLLLSTDPGSCMYVYLGCIVPTLIWTYFPNLFCLEWNKLP